MNEFFSVKEKLPEFSQIENLRGNWVLGRVNGSRTNIKTVRYIGTGYNKWQNRDRSWCEEEITHWCYIDQSSDGEYEPEFSGPEEYAFVSRCNVVSACRTVAALTLLKLMEYIIKNEKHPDEKGMDSIKEFSLIESERFVDAIFRNANEQPAQAPAAYLFANGNAAYFDEKGKQIPTLQSQGWIAIHDFVEKYPNAPISVQQADPMPKDFKKRFLKNIKEIERMPY